ncbi:hypothetical protein Tco_1107468, partial [Tanacetum coccineum]
EDPSKEYPIEVDEPPPAQAAPASPHRPAILFYIDKRFPSIDDAVVIGLLHEVLQLPMQCT